MAMGGISAPVVPDGVNMENDDTTNATKETSDISVEIDALKTEIENLKTSHAADLEKLAAENRRLKDKLVEYITIP